MSISLHSIPNVKEICEPLENHLGISFFNYLRTYNDYSYTFLLNDHREFATHYFDLIKAHDSIFVESLRNTAPNGPPEYFLWPARSPTPVMSLIDHHNIANGLTISYRKEHYCESFSFGFTKQSDDKVKFFFDNLTLLKRFCKYFKYQARDIINKSKSIQQASYTETFDFSYHGNKNSKMLSALELPENYDESDISILSKREEHCLKFITMGYSAKQIATELGISPRTVETHINSIKFKTGCKYKSDIIKLYNRNLII